MNLISPFRSLEQRALLWLEQLGQDVRYAVRVLSKSPAFTAAAVLVLALGIGLNTATFSAIYALAASPRPLAEPERLVQLYTQDKKEPTRFRAFSYAAYRELRERHELFTGILAQHGSIVAVGDGATTRRALSAIVSANFFDVLGARPERGRWFTLDEETPGADQPVVVMSGLCWRQSGSRPDAIGSIVRINGRPYTVVGITREDFTGTMALFGPDFYFPLGCFDSLTAAPSGASGAQRRLLEQADAFTLLLVGRLQPAVTADAAALALAGAAAGLERNFPVGYRNKTITAGPLPRFVDTAPPAGQGVIAFMAIVLLGLTGAVLLIVSLNLAGLLLARGHARRKEFAIRLALGGTRVRLVRQLLTEGLVIALGGGALGCVFSVWATDLVVAAISHRLPVTILLTTRMPMAVVGATLVLCTMATLFFALGPALTLSRRDVIPDLQQNAGEDVVRRHRWMPRHPLVVVQIALSLALLIGAGLFVRLISGALAANLGINADRTLFVEFDASLAGYDQARSLEIFHAVHERLVALPGVNAVSIASFAPYGRRNGDRSVRRAGTHPSVDERPTTPAEGLAFTAPYNAVGADYLTALGVPLIRGRTFTQLETERVGASPVAIIDEALAAKLWPDEEAVGRRIEWVRSDPHVPIDKAETESVEIVGIVRTTHLELWEKEPRGAIYVPLAQAFSGSVFFLVRSASASQPALERLREAVRRELSAVAPEVPFFNVRTFPEQKADSLELWALRRLSVTATAFAGFAALIAVIGLYGTKAYGVSRRTREIGIRLSLGAEPARLRNLILREGLSAALLGIGFGLLLGGALGRLLASAIAEFASFDLAVFGIATLAILAAAAAASWLPARRAAKVDPMISLRAE